MGNQETREKLLQAVKQLLQAGATPEQLTARRISAEAGVNLAMINYCFESKDELIKLAVDELLAAEFYGYAPAEDGEKPPKVRLQELLDHFTGVMVKYEKLSRLSIPYLLLNGDITLPLDILPFIREHHGGGKSEAECRIAAFGLVYNLQLLFYRSEEFHRYSGIDIHDPSQRAALLSSVLDLYLPDGK